LTASSIRWFSSSELIREAFNQVHRYSKESFNSTNSLFKFLQLFVISNGTDSRYFANTTQRNKNSYDFTMNWAKADNSLIKDLKDFTAKRPEQSSVDWDDVVFEVDLLKSQEINLDYILELIFENNKKVKTKADLVEEVRRAIRASLGNRAKESLLVDFIHQTDLSQFDDKASVIEAFFAFAQAEQQREAQALIAEENLNDEAAKRYISNSLKREFASENGTELNTILPKMSPLNPQYLTKKQSVFQKITAFVEKFKGVGGSI